MRKIILLLASLLFLTASYAALNILHPTLKASEVFFPIGKNGKKISLMELSQISIKDFQGLTEQKMNFFERLGFKMAQRKLRNNINPDGTFNKKRLEKYFTQQEGKGSSAVGGFALGFFFSLIGVLVAYVINDKHRKNRIKWAWFGFGAFIVLFLLIFLIEVAVNGFYV